MYGVSTSDAARTLQSKSVISRMLNKMKEVDPEGAKAVDALFGKKDPVAGPMMTFKGWIDKADRNMITAMTTNMSTVMRNAFGVGTNLTYGAAEEGIESLIFNTGRKIAGKMRGSPVAGDIGKGFNGVIDDTVNGYFYLGQGDLSREITEEALKNNPMLMSKMLATAEDMKNSDLIAPIRILNTPAVIMDNYVRRAIFSASIDNNLRKTGLNLVDLIAQDKELHDIYMEVDDFIPKVIASLEKVGSKDKAEALKVLEDQFKVFRKYNVGMDTPSAVLKDINREEIKAVDSIRDLVGGTYRDKETKKRIGLAKGGLASRR